jgi:hypothetical protein
MDAKQLLAESDVLPDSPLKVLFSALADVMEKVAEIDDRVERLERIRGGDVPREDEG